MNQPRHILLTHAGAFHSDELMAFALLERFYLCRPARVAHGMTPDALMGLLTDSRFPEFEPVVGFDGRVDARSPCPIVRTRDPAALAVARAHPSVFVIDVGGVFDPSALNFDHHQANLSETWDDGTEFSSTGLVWRWLRQRGTLGLELEDDVLDELERALIKPLDAHDNGQEPCGLATVCEGYNRHPAEGLDQFQKALRLMVDALENAVHAAETQARARRHLAAAWAARPLGQEYLMLREPLKASNGSQLLKEISGDEALLLGFPTNGPRYNLVSVRGDTPFSSKCPVPAEWRGRMDFNVRTCTRTVRVAFAHKNGFMCVVEGTQKDAEALARHIVAEHQTSDG